MEPREPISKLVQKLVEAYWEHSGQTPNIYAMEAVANIALEEAAKVADAHEDDMGHGKGAKIAAAIRAMIKEDKND